MKNAIIEDNSAFECWKKSLEFIKENSKEYEDDGKRVCKEISNLQIKIKAETKDIEKPINVLNTFDEWKYPSLKEIRNVMLAVNLPQEYAYSYGPRTFNFQKRINQINDYIIPLLLSKSQSRRAIISLWDPVEDSNVLNADAPGLIMIDFKLRNNLLHITAVVRSNDLFFGWPANVYQVSILQEYVRKKLGCLNGDITTFSTSAHIFDDQIEFIDEILKKD